VLISGDGDLDTAHRLLPPRPGAPGRRPRRLWHEHWPRWPGGSPCGRPGWPGPAPGGGYLSLTAQEHEIAVLAAGDMSNKQIGQRLFLSPRTVSGHLYRTFPRLGITSRMALHGALASLPQAEDSERGSERARRRRTHASPPLSPRG